MNSIFKKTISIIMVIGLIFAIFSGCDSKESEKKPDTGNTSSTSDTVVSEDSNFNPEGLPIVNEPITLNVLTTRWGSMGDSFTQNQWLIDLEKKTNVKIEWQVQSLNDWGEQKSIMLASGELPEVIIGSQTFNDTDIMNNKELFLDLTDLIDKYMPNLKEAMKTIPEFKTIVTFPDGKIYSLPKNLPSRPMTCNQPIINKKWLDNLGLKEPTTIDELYNVLKAFKEQDANGNGDPNDEFPICGAKGLPMDLLNPFGITDLNGTNMMVLDDGSLAYYPITENYKEGLKWLRKLYAEGIIDPESFTQDATMQDSKRKNPSVSLVGFDYAWTPDALFGQWSSEYIALAPIKGPDGKQYAAGDKNGISSIMRNEAEITKFCKHPEVAARWLDQFYDGEASIQNFWGAIGTVITKNSDGTYTLNDPPEGTSADAWYWDQSLRDFGPKYVSPEFQKKIKLSPNSGDGLKLELSKLGDPYITTPYPNVMFTVEEHESLSSLLTDIGKFVETTRADWITNGGIDEGWDNYIKQLEEMGLDQLIKIYTDAYNRFKQAN
jgi:putative aldouronate transport system substrate-binding protein